MCRLLSSVRFLGLCALLSFVNFAFDMSSAYVVDQSSDSPPDSRHLQPKSEIKEENPTQVFRQTKEDQGTAAGRVRRSSEQRNRVSGQWSTIGRVDQEGPQSKTKRNFMRFGRNEGGGGERDNGEVICVPVSTAGEDQEDERERSTGKVGVDEGWFQRSFRDQGSYDYSGKPFMRFGKRFMRFGRGYGRPNEFVCFRREEEGEGEEEEEEDGVQKRFMRFGRRTLTGGRDLDRDLFNVNDLKRFMRFGRSVPALDAAEESDRLKGDA